MKKYLTLIMCLMLAGNLFAQEKYPVPVLTGDQKHERMLGQYWYLGAAGINFAKTHGVTPYEYGKYVGNLYAPTWGAANDFEGYVRGMIYNFEFMRLNSMADLVVKENEDGSVSIRYEGNFLAALFPEGNGFASYDECVEFMKGMIDRFDDYMGATTTMELQYMLMITTIKKK
jgi:hypothetical protein